MENERSYKYGNRGAHIRELQQKLQEAGYEITADGIFGNQTKQAIDEYEADLAFTEHSYSFCVDRVTLHSLFEEKSSLSLPVLYPKGKGIFVRSWRHIEQNVGDMKNLDDFLKKHGISWICMLAVRQNMSGPLSNINKNHENWLPYLEDSDCDLWIWGWPIPDQVEKFVDEMEVYREAWNATGMIADVEGDFYNKTHESEILAKKMTSLGCPIGMTSFGRAKWHKKRLAFEVFTDFDFGMPQIYEQGETEYPENYPSLCMEDWKTWDYKKLIPASSAFKSPSGMESLLSRTPVEDTIVWWDWHNANLNPGRWEKIKAFSLPEGMK